MKFPGLDHYMTGVAVPVASLRTKKSLGSGEFLDLVELGRWCARVGVEIIQILPVNDTGFQSSPYSALSAYALHPLYVRIEALPEVQQFGENEAVKAVVKIAKKQRKHFEAFGRLHYFDVLLVKLSLLRQVYEAFHDQLATDSALAAWIRANTWVRSYAAFCFLKDKNGLATWKSWPEYSSADDRTVKRLWDRRETRKDLLFYAWVQWRLEDQLAAAARDLEAQGVYLKGDLPILMSEDSADVWASGSIFTPRMRAGAPPDMFSESGQNWGFPTYDWPALAADDYAWWKGRIRQAEKFYHAFRIDHVLGFFRIWRIAVRESAGILGHFFPAADLAADELRSAGFDDGRIAWLSKPHVEGGAIRALFGDQAEEAIRHLFLQISREDLYLFRDTIGEAALSRLEYSEEVRGTLIAWYRDRALVETDGHTYAPAWYHGRSRAYASLSPQERAKFDGLVAKYYRESESVWEKEGERLLGVLTGDSSMLACAEDLGVIPDCVPRVLERLGILGLRIPRWTRRYKEPGEPFIPPADYPPMTVCAPSVHDTSTLREWWEREADRDRFWATLRLPGKAPATYDARTASTIVSALLEASSRIVVFQLQDLFALSDGFRAGNAEEERINVPGTVDVLNWTYRMPGRVEELAKEADFCAAIRQAVSKRRTRSS